ncbi:integrase catalytic region [Burkholderia lata]|uniref:Integrase catalytic region n=1 Tax=Burkholderia lata (strain ATCC 17760 / DSM 23089 / LMG 22485 / NCIMB 9086 / R18194 / 383) TaxID=482957 RepID=A0A6P2ZSU3_BURL3|nr:integrase catalytic region [Burkholderia lata]
MTIDKSGANLAALQRIDAEREQPIRIRQQKYLNNIVEQDHRAIKRHTRAIMSFKALRSARIILSGIEVMYMSKKEQTKAGSKNQVSDTQFHFMSV